MGQRIHGIFMYLNPLTFERSIVIGGKHDRLIPMGTRVTPKPLASVGKVVGFNFFTIICAESTSLDAMSGKGAWPCGPTFPTFIYWK